MDGGLPSQLHSAAMPLTLTLLPARMAVVKLAPSAPIPGWAQQGDFFSITRTPQELSLVVEDQHVPDSAQCERGWRMLKLEGPFAFSLTGILASVLQPLAEAKVSIFAVSTFDTDHVMVKEVNLDAAIAVLRSAGHEVRM